MESKLNWKWVIFASVIFLIFIVFVLPQVVRFSIKMTGHVKSPDTSLIYSAEDLYQMAETYGESGRDAYIKLRWTFDVIWPVVYTLFLVLWTRKLSEYISATKMLRYMFIIPIIGMLLDFLENIGSTIVMFRYPLQSGIIATITPVMTFLKWITLLGSFFIITILMIVIGWKKIRNIQEV